MSEKLKIEVRGQGPELVLLHGWAMHSGIWGGLVDVLATGFRVHLVDLPGHGINRHIPLSRDLDELACMILSSVPQAIWMGWSLGGLVTLAAALAQPEKVQKAILVSATPSFSEKSLVCRMRGSIQKRIPMLDCSNHPIRFMFACSMRRRDKVALRASASQGLDWY